MKLFIQQRSEVAIYEQLYTQIINQILNGSLTADECLPSIRVVSRELNISVIPVKTAYELLERDGYIYTLQGKGCFVKPQASVMRRKMEIIERKADELIEVAKDLDLNCDDVVNLIKRKY